MWTDVYLVAYVRTHGNRMAAEVAILSDLLATHGVSGRVGFYGMRDEGQAYELLSALPRPIPHIEIVGEGTPNLFALVRQTKDDDELAIMRRIGGVTAEVMASVVRYTIA